MKLAPRYFAADGRALAGAGSAGGGSIRAIFMLSYQTVPDAICSDGARASSSKVTIWTGQSAGTEKTAGISTQFSACPRNMGVSPSLRLSSAQMSRQTRPRGPVSSPRASTEN